MPSSRKSSRKSKIPRSTLSQSLPDTAEASSSKSPFPLPRSSRVHSRPDSTPSTSLPSSIPRVDPRAIFSSTSPAKQTSTPLSTSPTSFPDLSSPKLPPGPSSTPSSPHSFPPLRTLRPPRPKLARPSSGVYTSFPLPPETPAPEEEAGWWDRVFGEGGGRREREEDEEMGRRGRVEWREVGKGGREGRAESGERSVLLGVRREEEPMRVSRECLMAEIRCYAKYMLPPIFVFVVLVLGFGLWVYRRAREEP